MREIIFLLLYSHDFAECSEEDSTPLVMRELAVARRYVHEAQVQKNLILEKLPQIDEQIKQAASAYEFERIPRIERNILRLSVYELLYTPDLPAKVAMAEAMRLARKFSSAESASFVNAILDAIYNSGAVHESTPLSTVCAE